MTDLMTIGYEGLEPSEFFARLKRCEVSVIVDVRELPISRKRGFAKSALAEGLEKHGIKYLHMPELGCPRDVRHEYREDGDWDRYTRRFKRHLGTQDQALRSLAALLPLERCCLLCFESDFNFCHRTFVAEQATAFVKDSVKIEHLTGPIQGRVVVRPLAAA